MGPEGLGGGGPGPGWSPGPPGPGPGWGPPGLGGPGWGPLGPGAFGPWGFGLGGCFDGLCSSISACLSCLCCCWLFQDCFGRGPRGYGPPGGPPY